MAEQAVQAWTVARWYRKWRTFFLTPWLCPTCGQGRCEAPRAHQAAYLRQVRANLRLGPLPELDGWSAEARVRSAARFERFMLMEAFHGWPGGGPKRDAPRELAAAYVAAGYPGEPDA